MFKERSTQKELLDGPIERQEDLFRNLEELHLINKRLGGYSISKKALLKVLNQPKFKSKKEQLTLVDIGCGGGENLNFLTTILKKSKFQVTTYGIDYNPVCIDYARSKHPDLTFILDDYRNLTNHVDAVDIIHASLFCHHLSTDEIVELIRFAQKNKSILIFNDLERNRFAYYSIKLLTHLFSSSYLVKNDAPLSVLRGFKKKEWKRILEMSNATQFSIKNKWAFRHEVIIYA